MTDSRTEIFDFGALTQGKVLFARRSSKSLRESEVPRRRIRAWETLAGEVAGGSGPHPGGRRPRQHEAPGLRPVPLLRAGQDVIWRTSPPSSREGKRPGVARSSRAPDDFSWRRSSHQRLESLGRSPVEARKPQEMRAMLHVSLKKHDAVCPPPVSAVFRTFPTLSGMTCDARKRTTLDYDVT